MNGWIKNEMKWKSEKKIITRATITCISSANRAKWEPAVLFVEINVCVCAWSWCIQSHSQPIKLNGNGYSSECSNNECECSFFVNFMHDAF